MNQTIGLGMPRVFAMFPIDLFSISEPYDGQLNLHQHCRLPHVVTSQQQSLKAIAMSRIKTSHQQLCFAFTNYTNEYTCLRKHICEANSTNTCSTLVWKDHVQKRRFIRYGLKCPQIKVCTCHCIHSN